MDEQWQVVPFSVHPASRMQELLGHATAISPLLEAMGEKQPDLETIRSRFSEILSTLEIWESNFICEGTMYRAVSPKELDMSTNTQRLANPCFAFADVSQANSLTHCWAFRIVCLLQLSQLDEMLAVSENLVCPSKNKYHTEIKRICDMVCRGLPYLLQREMRLYGSMSAGFPLHMVSESLQTLRLPGSDLNIWHEAIKEQMQSQRIALYEEMVETGTVR